MIPYLLLLPGSLAVYSSAASVPPTLDLVSNASPTNLQAQSNISTVVHDFWYWHCTTADRWIYPLLEPEDCEGVLDYFYYETMREGGSTRTEFLSPNAKRTARGEWVKTPRKYTFGTCTLAIVMIEDFPEPASLPGGPMKGPPSDFSTFHNIWKVAENLVGNCVMKIGQVGWQPTGLNEGIGVFIWSTESLEDLEIERDDPRLQFTAKGRPGNSSVARA